MAHRGRLNVLANIVGKSYDQIFKEFEGHVDPTSVQGSGDVKYHLGASGKYESPSGRDIKVELAPNPSHLETVDPIVLGMARARQDQIDPPGSYPVLPLLIHGDAAFAGQGVVAECLAMSDITGYRVGGTIHLIINNQIGFTTAPEYARSSLYCSDVAKTVQAPIFHVNGDDPEACLRVARLAFEYRQRFHKDVVIDMVCYRRYGHNEGDDPSYTQPLMYKAIAERRPVRKLYVEALVKRGELSLDEAESALADFQHKLQVALDETRAHAPEPVKAPKPPKPQGVLPHVATGVDRSRLDTIFTQLTNYPDGFTVHPKLGRQFETRAKLYHEQGEVEWATAEALAYGSLLMEGTPVRLAGEDSRRGTFSQRHAALTDYETGKPWFPLGRPARGGPILGLRLAALGVRRARLRVRLRERQQGLPGAVGGPVRRLHQRRPDHHRPVPRRRRGQVGHHMRAGAAAPARLRGPGSGALQRPDRTVPHPVRRGQHPGRQRHHCGPVLPSAAPPDEAGRASPLDRVHPQGPAADEGEPFADRGAGVGAVPGGARRPEGRRS